MSINSRRVSKINQKEFLRILKSPLWIFKEQGSVLPATHRYESGGVPSDGACIWRPCRTRCIWTCGCRPLGWAVGAAREKKKEGERERDLKKRKRYKHGGGKSSVHATSQMAPVANEASWLSTPTSVEQLQAAAAITERITYLLISWLHSQRRPAFRIWQPRK